METENPVIQSSSTPMTSLLPNGSDEPQQELPVSVSKTLAQDANDASIARENASAGAGGRHETAPDTAANTATVEENTPLLKLHSAEQADAATEDVDDNLPLAQLASNTFSRIEGSLAEQSQESDEDLPLAAIAGHRAPITGGEDDDEVPLISLVKKAQDEDEDVPLSQYAYTPLTDGTEPQWRYQADRASLNSRREPELPLGAEAGNMPSYANRARPASDRSSYYHSPQEMRYAPPPSTYSSSHYFTPTSTFRNFVPSPTFSDIDPHTLSRIDAVISARISPLIGHIQHLERQVAHLSEQVADLTAHRSTTKLGPGRFLPPQQHPAEELARRMDRALGAVGMVNPSAVDRRAELETGLVAGMPVKMHVIGGGDRRGDGGGKVMGGGGMLYDLAAGRKVCWKCKGKGWEHDSPSKHKTPSETRCKKCVDCHECGGSGMLFDEYAANNKRKSQVDKPMKTEPAISPLETDTDQWKEDTVQKLEAVAAVLDAEIREVDVAVVMEEKNDAHQVDDGIERGQMENIRRDEVEIENLAQ